MQTTTDTLHEGAHARKRLAALPLLAALVLGAATAGSWTAGEVALAGTRGAFDGWARNGEVASLAAWESERARLAFALRLLPESAEQQRLVSLLHEWRFFVADSPVTSEADIIRFRQAAIDALRRSAELRPAWPAGWAELARQKAMLGQHDDELLRALERALRLGPYEESVALLVTDVATLTWPFLAADAAIRDLVLASLTRSLSGPDDDALLAHLVQITDRNMQGELCPLLPLATLSEWTREACSVAQ